MASQDCTIERQEAFCRAREATKIRFRFKDIHNIITPPTDVEIDAALEDAASYINSYPPITYYDYSFFLSDDALWSPIWYQTAGMFVLKNILADWTANGYDIAFQEINIPDRKGDYEALLSTEQGSIDGWLERVKPTSQRISLRTPRIKSPIPRRTILYPGFGGKRTSRIY